MVAKGVQALSVMVSAALLVCFWPSLMHNISRLYETFFLQVHYEYVGLFDPIYQKQVSWGLKNICLKEYATSQVNDFLDHIEDFEKKTIWIHRNKLTEEAHIGEYHFIIKSEKKEGFFANLFSMGMAVNVWNNAHWVRNMGIPVLKPVALLEKRKWNSAHTFIVYLYEGRDCEKELERDQSFFSGVKDLQKLLVDRHVIHHDFRLRNILVLEDQSLQLIDIDKIHKYPRNSYVFRERMNREVRKFNDNLASHSQTTKRLEI